MAAEVRFKKELLDELLAGRDAKTVFENDGLLDELRKALAEWIMNTELDRQASRQRFTSSSPRRTRSRGSFQVALIGYGS